MEGVSALPMRPAALTCTNDALTIHVRIFQKFESRGAGDIDSIRTDPSKWLSIHVSLCNMEHNKYCESPDIREYVNDMIITSNSNSRVP